MEKVYYLEKMNPKTSDMVFPPSFQTRGQKMRLWMGDDSYKEVPISEGAKIPSADIKKITFGSNFGSRMMRYEIRVRYEVTASGTKPASDEDKQKDILVKLFLMQHPLLAVNGVPNAGSTATLFNLVDVDALNVDNVSLHDDKLKVANMVSHMDYDEMKDVSFYFGSSPKNKDKKTLQLFLSNFDSGLLFDVNGKKSNIKEFLDLWGSPDKIPAMYINARKAIEYKIVEQKEEGKYYYQSTFIGTDMDRLCEWFDSEPDLYSHICKEIKKNDGYGEEKKMDVLKEKIASGEITPEADAMELKSLREQAVHFKEIGLIPANVNVDKMKDVAKLKEYIQKAKNQSTTRLAAVE